MPQATYTQEEQIHSLSLLSNAAYDLQETSFATLQSLTTSIITKSLADTTIQGYIGTWQIVWGPVVFSEDSTAPNVVADNTMVLFYNGNSKQPVFVVAIAGTNIVSTYGWLKEDFDVDGLVDWGTVINKKVDKFLFYPSISIGTNNGLQILLGMKDTTRNNVTMLSALNSFVKSQNITGATVAVAGHSLGGALAPVLAMYMVDTASTWNTVSGSITTIQAWPTAGPTPGNADFATYYQNNFPNIAANYTSKYNTLDVIPHAWQDSMLSVIPSIYSSTKPPYIAPPETVAPYCTPTGTLVAGVFLETINQADYIPIAYTQIAASTRWISLTGTFDTATDQAAHNKINLATALEPAALSQYSPYVVFLYRFIAQLGYQHTTAYNALLLITGFAAEFNNVKNGIVNSTEDARREVGLNIALQRYYGLPAMNFVSSQTEEMA